VGWKQEAAYKLMRDSTSLIIIPWMSWLAFNFNESSSTPIINK
jgi:hypothetical protein